MKNRKQCLENNQVNSPWKKNVATGERLDLFPIKKKNKLNLKKRKSAYIFTQPDLFFEDVFNYKVYLNTKYINERKPKH